jgi:hypothetical protein
MSSDFRNGAFDLCQRMPNLINYVEKIGKNLLSLGK